jgi:LPXTG-site transpeptidase (sortase) family protein
MLYGMATLIFLVGLAVSLAGLRTNQKAQAQVSKLSSNVASGTNESVPPSTTKPTSAVVSSYQVAPNLPKYIDIPSLKVHSRIFAVGATKDGSLDTPKNVYNTAWYKNSSLPGASGAMLIDGHSGLSNDGVFNGLIKLKAGDTIKITRGDGATFNYRVAKSQLYPSDNVDMASLLVSADTSKPGLNLISCAGDVIPGTYDFNKRIAVFAVAQ